MLATPQPISELIVISFPIECLVRGSTYACFRSHRDGCVEVSRCGGRDDRVVEDVGGFGCDVDQSQGSRLFPIFLESAIFWELPVEELLQL